MSTQEISKNFKNVEEKELNPISGGLMLILVLAMYAASVGLIICGAVTIEMGKNNILGGILVAGGIFLLIAGTYTPFMLNLMPNWIGITICTACWIIAVFGIIFQPWLMKKSDRLNTFLYLFQGWLVLFAFKPVVEALPVTGLVLLVAGGLLYSFGTIFYNWQRLPYHHAVWHLFVLGGSVTHYFAVMYTI